jgi:hypothetical protein
MSGRGRGKKYIPPSGGRMFLMRSAEECGLDSRNLRSLQDITRPTLFPPIKLHSSGDNRMLLVSEQHNQTENSLLKQEDESITETKKQVVGVKRSAQTLSLISKGREIHHRIQNSVFYVRPTKDVPDVVRYCDSARPPPPEIDASAVLANCLGGRKRTKMGLYVPEELVSGQKLQNSSKGEKYSSAILDNLNVLAAKERLRLGSIDQAPEEEEENKGDDEYESTEDLEESDGEDYVRDYYESEGDYSDGGDNEATF